MYVVVKLDSSFAPQRIDYRSYYSMSTLTMNWLQNSRKDLALHFILRVLCLN